MISGGGGGAAHCLVWALPVTQVSIDSVFSRLNYVLNDLRMRSGDDVVDAILVLCANN